jgi:hypothetical protein
LNVSNNASFYSPVFLRDVLKVDSNSYFNSDVDVVGNTSILKNINVSGTSYLKFLNVNKNASFYSAVFLGDDLNVTGNTSLSSTLTVYGNTSMINNLTVYSNTSVIGSTNLNYLNVSNTAVFSNPVFVNSSLNVNDNINITKDLNVNGNTSILLNLQVNKNINVSDTSNLTFLNVLDKSTFMKPVTMNQNLNVSGNTNISTLIVKGNTNYNTMNGISIFNIGNISTDSIKAANVSGDYISAPFISGVKARFTTLEYTTLTQVATAANFQNTITTLEVSDYNPTAEDLAKGNVAVTGYSNFYVDALFKRSIKIEEPCTMTIGGAVGNYSKSISCTSNTYGTTRFAGSMIIGTGNPNVTATYFDLNAATHPVGSDGYSNGYSNGIVYNGPVKLSGADGLTVAGILEVTGGVTFKSDLSVTGNVISSSDKKLKNNITKLEDCLEKIKSVNGYRYNRIDLDGEAQIGLIAQEVEINFPELVFEKNNLKSINYSSFIAVLLQCIKELKNKIEILENKILI